MFGYILAVYTFLAFTFTVFFISIHQTYLAVKKVLYDDYDLKSLAIDPLVVNE